MKAGRAFPGLETLCKIADYFDVTTDYLLGRSDF
ncbi:MAG: helix-turn-helix domain-containing protein [Firmicutes bacterium]|nr:helix-turn-helix domain-containing protein [Bacillota bacterium]